MDGERESSESALTRFQGQRLQGWERPNSQGQKEDSSLDPRTHPLQNGWLLPPSMLSFRGVARGVPYAALLQGQWESEISGCWLRVSRVPAGWSLPRLVPGSVFRRAGPEPTGF